jgi:hypothetical protein
MSGSRVVIMPFICLRTGVLGRLVAAATYLRLRLRFAASAVSIRGLFQSFRLRGCGWLSPHQAKSASRRQLRKIAFDLRKKVAGDPLRQTSKNSTRSPAHLAKSA